LLVARCQIDAKSIGKCNQVASGMTIPFDILGNQLFNARHRHGNRPLLVALFELYWLVERAVERQLEIQGNRRRLTLGTLRVAALPGLELIFFGWTAWTDSVLLVRRFSLAV
jgi:hypothetical protein